MNKTVIEIDENKIDYKNFKQIKINNFHFVFVIIVTIIILSCSLLFSLLNSFEWKPFYNLKKFKRIKKNMNSWYTITKEKTNIEKDRGKLLYLTNKDVGEFQCLDFEQYYVPGRISKYTYLLEYIRRGNSGPWIINKAAKKDEAALQFCKYLILTNNKTITCGINMYEELGFSGYFIPGHPCDNGIDIINKNL